MKNLPKKTQIPVYEEYHTFLKNMESTAQFKDHKYYLKQYAILEDVANLLPSAAYILNYETEKYLFVGKSLTAICGYPIEEYLEKGRGFFLPQVHPDDLKLYASSAFTKFVSYTRQLSVEALKQSRFSVNFCMKRKDGVYIKILQQYVVLETNNAGYPLLTLGTITDITNHKADDKVVFSISKYDEKTGFEVISTDSFPQISLSISKREHEILKHILQGLSSKQIADKLYISLHTVNAHRRNILQKTACKNTVELGQYAMVNGFG